MPSMISKLRDKGPVSKDDNYWKVQEALNKPGLQNNPEYIKWKQRQVASLRSNGDEDGAVEPIPMA